MLGTIRDRLLFLRLRHDEKTIHIGFFIIGILIFLLTLNSVFLSYILTKKDSLRNTTPKENPIFSPPPTPTPCVNCETTPIPTTQTNVQSVLQTQQNSQPQVVDYFIPLGSGTNQTNDWANITGAQVSVDFGQYQNIKEIRFETTVSTPTSSQIVWVRLFNTTDKHPVWFSEVQTQGEASAYLVSQPIAYDIGLKTYQVQMKTQLQGLTNLTQARIHVILQ